MHSSVSKVVIEDALNHALTHTFLASSKSSLYRNGTHWLKQEAGTDAVVYY